MVDLVKIRKKKAEKKAAEAAAAAATAAESSKESSSRQVVESSSGEKPQPPVEAPAESPVILSRQSGEAAADGEGSPDSGDTRGESGQPLPHPSPESGDSSPSAGLRMTNTAAMTRDVAPQSSKLDKFKAEAGKRRETATAQQDQQHEGVRLEALTFLIAGEQYAVDIEKIVEIVTPRPVTRVPNSDDSVLGIISLRGTIVTLLDVRKKLRHPPATQETADTRIVVVDSGSETTGFTVDRVLRVVKTTQDEVEPHPVVHAGELNEAIRGVFRSGGALTILLDLDKLLDHNALAARPA